MDRAHRGWCNRRACPPAATVAAGPSVPGPPERSTTMTTTVAEQTRSEKAALRPFQVDVPETELTDLRRRIQATRWPERETVTDATQGVQLETMQALAR